VEFLSENMLAILGVMAAVVIAAVMYQQAKKRREALAALARELGLSFHPGPDAGHDDQYAHFEIFRRGRSRRAFNTLLGEVDLVGQRCHVRMGDFRYTTGSGKNRSTHTFSYLIVHLPWTHMPALLIRPEGLFDKIAGAIGFDDIDFESAEFSRRFHVKSTDKRFAYDVIHPRMMEFLMSSSDPPTADIEHGRCLISDGKRRWDPAQFRERLRWTAGFVERIPDHVVNTLEAA